MFHRMVVALFALAMCAPAQDAAASAHAWDSIRYPDLPVPWGAGSCGVVVSNERDGLRVDLLISEGDHDLPGSGEMRLAFHRGSSKPVRRDLGLVGGTSTRGSTTFHYPATFAWGPNVLEESWLELTAGEHPYWLELPYGFSRDPTAPLAPAMDDAGPPSLAPAMANLRPGAVIVPWLHVEYDVGAIQNGWRLTVLQSNPFDARTELVLYRDDAAVGKSMYLWNLHEPRTAVRILDPKRVVPTRCMQLRLHDDGMRRSDTFYALRNSGGEGRCWGVAVIEIGGETHRVVMPSSLFRTTHGAAEPHHPARLRDR